MTDQQQRLTTEDFAERAPGEREPVGQTPSDRDIAEPNLTDQERYDREPVAQGHHGHDPDGQEPVTQHPATHESAVHESAVHGSATRETGAHESGTYQPDTRGSGTHGTDTVRSATDRTGAFDQDDVRREPVEHSAVSTTAGDAPLFTTDDAADYQAEWRALQADFVDDPREAVQRADELVAQVMQSLATTFTEHKRSLEEQWQRGGEAETEELRQALKRYRTFFDRLLSV